MSRGSNLNSKIKSIRANRMRTQLSQSPDMVKSFNLRETPFARLLSSEGQRQALILVMVNSPRRIHNRHKQRQPYKRGPLWGFSSNTWGSILRSVEFTTPALTSPLLLLFRGRSFGFRPLSHFFFFFLFSVLMFGVVEED